MAYTKSGEEMKKAAKAMSDLHMFAAIIALLENGLITADCYMASEKIRRICNIEKGKCLRRHDAAIKKAGGGTHGL